MSDALNSQSNIYKQKQYPWNEVHCNMLFQNLNFSILFISISPQVCNQIRQAAHNIQSNSDDFHPWLSFVNSSGINDGKVEGRDSGVSTFWQIFEKDKTAKK